MNRYAFRNALAMMALAATPCVWAADADTTKFLTEAIQGNLGEIKVGELAQQQGMSEGVKSFGAMLQRDHSAANAKAMQVAKSLGITPPQKPGPKQTEVYESLRKASGAEFDRKFVASMLEDHRKDIAEYQQQAHKSQDAASRYAMETLPDLQTHMQSALSLQGKSAQPATLMPSKGSQSAPSSPSTQSSNNSQSSNSSQSTKSPSSTDRARRADAGKSDSTADDMTSPSAPTPDAASSNQPTTTPR